MGIKVLRNDLGGGLRSDQARKVDLHEAGLIWSDEVRGVNGNFGLIDDWQRTVQFYSKAHIPNHVKNAGHLPVVLMDFPQLDRERSYNRRVTMGEVHRLIETAFKVGADLTASVS